MTQYESALRAMHMLLTETGEKKWAEFLEQDLNDWIFSKNTEHHLTAYGGMGSFNDLTLSKANGHKVTAEQEPIVNELFGWMRSFCAFLAANPEKEYTVEQLKESVGFMDAPLKAFVEGESAPVSLRGMADKLPQLGGMRCLACGYSEISARNIRSLAATMLMPELVFKAVAKRTFSGLIQSAMIGSIANIKRIEDMIKSALSRSKIELSKDDEWHASCPKCGAKETAAYRWDVTSLSPLTFKPAANNLELKPKN